MSILSKFIGIVMVLSGLYGLYLSIPPLISSSIVDQFNPFVRLGITQPSTTGNVVDVLISFVIFIIGLVLLTRSSKPKMRK